MKMRFWLLWAFFQIPVLLYGQKEAANWVLNFGTLKFDSLANITFSVLPKNVNGQGVNDNPLPVVSSCDGRILFFENSSSLQRTLTDSNINLIINGDSIGAGRWAPSIIEKISLNESLYMMFSGGPGSLPFGNLVYSRIEKSTTSDSFIVTQKNQIIDSLTGGFALTAHSNGVDKWLVAANRIAQKYSVYRIDSAGSITFHSSLFNSRLYHNQGASEEMTFSPDGRFLVTFGLPNYRIELLKFNPSTGFLDSVIFLPPMSNSLNTATLVCERFAFSPNGTKLYVDVNDLSANIRQMDLTVWDSASIVQSRQSIGSGVTQNLDVVLASDSKMYLYGLTRTVPTRMTFSRIPYPDLPYPACGLEDTIYFFPPTATASSSVAFRQRMPYFSPRYFYSDRFSVVANDVCLGDTARLRLYDYDNLNSVRWDFGDPASPNNTDTVFAPVHFYSQPGTYTITAIADYCNKLDTLTQTIRVWDYPESPNLPDTVLCASSSLPVALVPDSALSIRWSNGDSTWTTNFSTGGWHWAEISNACFSTRDSFYITLHEPPQSGLLSDTNVCAGTSLTLTPQPGDYTWQWQDGSTQPLTVTEAGTYALLMTNACGTFVHEVRVDYQQAPELSLNDTSRCEGQFYRIELPEVWQGSYQWTDGSSERIRILADSGWYSAEVSNPCGTASDQFYLSLVDCECHMYLPTAFSPNGDGLNDELIIKTRCPLSSYQMEVYDRWGRQIFTSNDLNRGWDGTFQGQDVPNGSYPFIIRYTPEGRNQRVEKGVVNVLR